MSNDTRSRPMTAETIHTCSYSCDRPECIRAQRDELAARLTAAQRPAAVDEAMVERALIELRTGVEMDAAYDPMGAAKLAALDAAIAAFASTPPGAHSDDLPALLDNLMRAAFDDGDKGREKFSGATMAAREAVLAHVRSASAPSSAPVGVEEMQRRLDREESDHGRTIDQRDAAEDALGRMFQAVTGRPAEWSSSWGYVDAIEEVEEHVAALATERDQLAAENEALRAERDVLARENEAMKRCATKYLGWLGVTHMPLDEALRGDMSDPTMCGDAAIAAANGGGNG